MPTTRRSSSNAERIPPGGCTTNFGRRNPDLALPTDGCGLAGENLRPATKVWKGHPSRRRKPGQRRSQIAGRSPWSWRLEENLRGPFCRHRILEGRGK